MTAADAKIQKSVQIIYIVLSMRFLVSADESHPIVIRARLVETAICVKTMK